jgi:hypothetical protein
MDRSREAVDVELLGRLVAGAGVASALAGGAAWLTIRSQLVAEKIAIPDSAAVLPGRRVTGPVTAYAEADAIRRVALAATHGRTYGELDEDDPLAEMAVHASLLRASLFTSVLAFGIAGAEMALGAVLVAIGTALTRIARRLPG